MNTRDGLLTLKPHRIAVGEAAGLRKPLPPVLQKQKYFYPKSVVRPLISRIAGHASIAYGFDAIKARFV